MALAVVARMEHHVGKKGFSSDLIAKVAVGSRDAAVLQWGFDSLSTYGLLGPRGNAGRRAPGKAWTVGEVADLLSALVDARALDEALVSREIQGKLRTYKEIATNELGRGVMLQRIQDFQMVFPHADKLEVVAAAAGLQEDLVAELRDLRRTLAERENVPAYVVFSNATLEELASFRPTTRRALETVRGMGLVRADRFGAPILEAIRAWNLRGS
jgi:ATP-dependent DNA helicase RecQ